MDADNRLLNRDLHRLIRNDGRALTTTLRGIDLAGEDFDSLEPRLASVPD
jgi:hypothetical protein